MPLTDTAIRNTKPGITPSGKPTDKPYRLADAAGLYLEVTPKGGKYWRLKYRFDGKEKRLALGVWRGTSATKPASCYPKALTRAPSGRPPKRQLPNPLKPSTGNGWNGSPSAGQQATNSM
jgi:hypothetical protein